MPFAGVADTMISVANEELTTTLKFDEIVGNSKILKQATSQFINQIHAGLMQNNARLKTIELKIAQLKNSIDGTDGQNVIDTMRQVKETMIDEIEYTKYTSAKLNYQHILNNFLNQQVKTIYVYSNAKTRTVELVEIDSEMALKLDKYRGTMRYADMNYINTQRSKQNQLRNAVEEQQAKPLQNTYFEVLRRARISKRKFAAAGKKNFILIMWNPPDWQMMQVSSEGDINEAYANFYLNKQFNLFKADIESNVGTFMTNKYGVVSVDNISGLLSGDINIGNIAYAIKSRGASALGDRDIIAIAFIIESLPEEQLTMDLLENIKKELESHKNETRQKLNQELNIDYEDLIKSIQEQVAKIPPINIDLG